MKKTIMFLGMLAVGFANAQQESEGKVGINTEEPSATLNVKSKTGTTDTTKNFELENANGIKMVTVLDNGNVGIGKDSPEYILDIASSDASYYKNNIAIRAARNTVGTSGIDLYRSRGTVIAPKAVSYGDFISALNTFAYTGTTFKNVASIRAIVTGNISNGIIPTSISLTGVAHNIDITTNTHLLVHHTGNIGIGLGTFVDSSTGENLKMPIVPTTRLHIKAETNNDPLRIDGLKNTEANKSYKSLVVDADGVVKVGSAVSNANVKLGTGTSKSCNADNAGTINYEEITRDGKKTGVFGFCMKRNDNEYVWAYMVGGTNPFGTSANGANFADGVKD